MPDANTVTIGLRYNGGTGHVRVYTFLPTSTSQLENETLRSVTLFPNPVHEVLQLRLSDISSQQEMGICILNNLGQVVYQGRRMAENIVEIREVANLAPRNYFLYLRQAGEELSLPFVKQ